MRKVTAAILQVGKHIAETNLDLGNVCVFQASPPPPLLVSLTAWCMCIYQYRNHEMEGDVGMADQQK